MSGNNQSVIKKATGNGTSHFISMKFTSLALIPFVAWLLLSFIYFMHSPVLTFLEFIHMPINAVMAILFSGFCLHHGAQGMQMIIEDYVKCSHLKHFSVFLNYFIAIFTFVAFVVSIFYS